MAADRPNIVWLLTDHHAFAHHLSLPGPKPEIPTHDRIAADGVRFDRAYAVCPLCTPARASMLTGVYPHKHGMALNNGDCGARREFDRDARLFSHYLRQAGYRCGYFGKWHCGVRRGPMDYGFEGWSMPGYGLPYKTDRYAAYLAELGLPQMEVDVDWHENTPSRQGRHVLRDDPHEGFHMNAAGIMTTPVETHEAYFVTHMANQWLAERARDGQPFCLRVDVWGPHQPHFVGEPFAGSIDPASIPEYPNYAHGLADRPQMHRDFRDRWTRRTWEQWAFVLARCFEHVRQVDAALGRVVDALEELHLADDTLLVYTADHGDILGAHGGTFDKGALMVEETERIPLAVRWPGRIAPGQRSDALLTHMDIVPTVLEAAGAEIPPETDGRSLLPLAQDPAADWRDDLMCQHHGHLGELRFQRMLRWGDCKYVAHLRDSDELYDLKADPYELTNRIDDPAMADVLAEMRRRLARRMIEHDDNAPFAQGLRSGKLE